MSVYKEETRYIRESIDSILNQTYKDFEFIIVGDTPQPDRDRVFSIIEEYSSKDTRIKFIPNETNLGLTKSLNVGLSYCKGKYIARMDADDISLPTRLEKQVAFMDANPDVLASGAWLDLINENGDNLNMIYAYSSDKKENRLKILLNSILGHPVAIFHRIINNKPIKYDENVIYAQDYSLWVEILKYGEISNIGEVLLKYRITEGQISSAHIEKQQECARVAQRNAFIQLYDFPLDESFLNLLADYSIKFNNQIIEEEAKSRFCDFFQKVRVSKINYDAIKFLVELYINYFSKIIPKRRCHFIYDITWKNPKLFLILEFNYISDKMSRKI